MNAEERAFLKLFETIGKSRKTLTLFASFIGPRRAREKRALLAEIERIRRRNPRLLRLEKRAVALAERYVVFAAARSGGKTPAPGRYRIWFLALAAALDGKPNESALKALAARADAPPGAADFIRAVRGRPAPSSKPKTP